MVDAADLADLADPADAADVTDVGDASDAVVPPGFWRAVEAVHAVVYFAPDVRAAYQAIGLRGFWMGYFASRSAALGTPSPELVTALFFGFAPGMVRRALPDAWERVTPDVVLAAREGLAVRMLTRLLPELPLEPIADRLDELLPTLDTAGRPLAAAELTARGSSDALARLWRAVTVLREYRGDSHVAALVAAGLDGAEANLSHAATGALPPDQRSYRGWSSAEWDAAAARLHRRGWLDLEGALTAAGRAGRRGIERATDAAAARALAALAPADVAALTADLLRLAAGPVERAIPYPNPTGVLRP